MKNFKLKLTGLIGQSLLLGRTSFKCHCFAAATFILLLLGGCEKGFLETKPNKALLIPQTLTDFQRLLDNTYIMNVVPSLPLVAVDEHYTDQNTLNAWLTPAERNSYTWAADIFEGQISLDWNYSYKQIFYSNVVLEGLETLEDNLRESDEARALKGSALFFRAHALYNLAQIYCQPYQKSGNELLMGLPLKSRADINERVVRSTLSETYQQIINDFKTAIPLLPASVASKNRPSKSAAMGMLARVYQTMQNYPEALRYANEVLTLSASLLDFNTLSATLTSTANPFPVGLPNANPEVVFFATLLGYSYFTNNLRVDSTIYQSYAVNDLRKSVFFVSRANGQINIKGTHAGTSGGFTGVANDELLLIRAESYARAGNTASAMADLNQLLIKRFKTGTYVNRVAGSPEEALEIILTERRKELFRRCLRWADLRRLNQDPLTAKVLQHNIGGKTYTLEPGSLRYTYPIPPDEIIASGIAQNPR